MTKSNDKMEGEYLLRAIREYIEFDWKNIFCNNDERKLYLSVLDGMIPRDRRNAIFPENRRYISDDREEYKSARYVACFSYERDLLSQWRGYADDGMGLCIGFDKDYLYRFCYGDSDMNSGRITDVSYDFTEELLKYWTLF